MSLLFSQSRLQSNKVSEIPTMTIIPTPCIVTPANSFESLDQKKKKNPASVRIVRLLAQ